MFVGYDLEVLRNRGTVDAQQLRMTIILNGKSFVRVIIVIQK